MTGGFKFAFDFSLGANGNVTAWPSYNAVQWLFSSEKTLAQNLSGTSVTDWSQYAGAARAVQPGRALAFDGTTGYVLKTSAVGLPTNYPVTIAAWVRADVVTGSRCAVSFSDNVSNTNSIRLEIVNSKVASNIYNSTSQYITAGATTVAADTWYRIAFVAESTTSRKIYLNGVIDGAGTESAAYIAGTLGRVGIGALLRPSIGLFFDGDIHDAQIWNAAWTADDAFYDFQNKNSIASNRTGTALNVANLVFSLPCAAGSGTTAYDISGNANHGTHVGGVTHATFTDGAGNDTNNQHGYTLSGAVFIPLTPSSNYTLSATGASATVTGRVPYTATIAGHNGATNGFHTGCTLTLNPVGAPQLSPLYGVTWTYGAALPSGVSADFDGTTYTNIRYG